MARHNYKFRPTPKWEDGKFVPSSPVPMPKPLDEWSKLDMFDSIIAMSRNPILATTKASMTREDAMSTALGQTVFVATSPEAIQHIFIKNAANYAMHPVRQSLLKPALNEGLLAAEGDVWKRARRALSPIFTPRHIGEFPTPMRNVTEALLESVFPKDQIVETDEAFLKLAYAVLSETLFSGEIDENLDEALRDIATFMNTLGKPDPLDLLNAPDWLPRITKIGWQKSVNRMRTNVRELALDRRARIEKGEVVKDDFLTLLLTAKTETGENLSDEQVEDQIMTFIGAGHETTSRALTWLSYLLSQDTAARDRMEAEIDALDMNLPTKKWIDHIPFAMACFNEGMRLYPPAPLISRVAISDDEIDGQIVPKGATTFINLWALHRHQNHWDKPDAFDPDRFTGDRAKGIGRFDFLPFGVGHRVCIGQRFALQEAAVMMAVMFRKIRLHWIEEETHPWPLMRITTRPENPLKMRVEWR
ncbi:MAG: cytochrome P450 [Litorimonas sp.]